ncbi:hypothetical protein WP8S17C03_30600 [Metapseudomonas otitidis]|uniref:Uncharacterized protein n=1 Tax=Metapseudomonas otitidis TaxID=319939 RepID=A0A6S5RLN4_9GAMM|nr:hypothetical protein [Pseudomonas otitidis]MCO7557375.1 hypothetical protein [Pseudomonas otitidis]BBT17011.1 hypothetical protein WP8S17C03_30600 [Pseudomonas otitidis]
MNDTDLMRTLRALAGPTARPGLTPLEPRGALKGQRVSVPYTPRTRTGGGIASPLTEPAFAAREWWDDGWKTSDGLFTIPMPKKLVMKDANGEEVILEFANPKPVPAP